MAAREIENDGWNELRGFVENILKDITQYIKNMLYLSSKKFSNLRH